MSASDHIGQDSSGSGIFTLHGCREILREMQGAVHFELQVKALEGAVSENPGLAMDLARALVESACSTILRDHGISIDRNKNLPDLARETLGYLDLIPDDNQGPADPESVRESLRLTAKGILTTVQGLCELRNRQGLASHGKDAYAGIPEPLQAVFCARAADTVVHFMFSVHQNYGVVRPSDLPEYIDYKEFNQFIDENNEEVRIFDLAYLPSEVLFYTDQTAYQELMRSIELGETAEISSDLPEEEEVAAEA